MRWLFILLLVSVIVAGCAHDAPASQANQSEPALCAADVLECPDGSFVARDTLHDCAFKPCPEPQVS